MYFYCKRYFVMLEAFGEAVHLKQLLRGLLRLM